MASYEWPPETAGVTAGVASINGLAGSLFIAAGANVAITPSGGDTFTIAVTSIAIGDPVDGSTPYGALFVDGSGNLTENSILPDSSGVNSIDIGNRVLFDGSALNSLDWANRSLNKNTNPVLNWNTQTAYDDSSRVSILWNARTLRDAGTIDSLDWQNRYLIDTAAKNSIDWNARTLINSSLAAVLNWNTSKLLTSSNKVVVDWQNTSLKDATEVLSANWNARKLYQTNGTTVAVDWGTNAGEVLFSGAPVVNGGSGLTYKWLNETTAPSDPVNPVKWLLITIGGTDYKIPAFL